MTQPEWLTPQQAADLLQMSKATILNWIKAGKLEAQKLGHHTIRISTAALDKLTTPDPE